MSDASPESPVRPPWFAGREVPVFIYRINRRPGPLSLFGTDQPEPFIDHLAECLLFGPEVVTAGHGHERHWKLGNKLTGPGDPPSYLSGWVGYTAPDAEERDVYDSDASAWVIETVLTERQAAAPFVVVADRRYLLVAKHPTFAPGTIPVIFEALLNQGEEERTNGNRSTDWAVEPLLDEPDFQRWLQDTAVLDKAAFHVRLPNHDAEDSFRQINDHLNAMEAAALDHTLTPRDPNRGLSKDFTADPISHGLLEMAVRGFAQVAAKGRNAAGRLRTYNQKTKVRSENLLFADTPEEAQQALIDRGLQIEREDSDGQSTA